MSNYARTEAEVRKPPRGSLFLTVTISNKLNNLVPKIQFMKTQPLVRRILDKYMSDYCLTTEVTEQGNVHYHAWIIFRNINHKARLCVEFKAKRELGFIKINPTPIENVDRTYNYMIDANNEKVGKNLKEAFHLLQRIDIVYNYTPLITNMNYNISDTTPSSPDTISVSLDTPILN